MFDGVAGYSNVAEIISIAKLAGADAIHPGYGFLAEDAAAALMIEEAGITWIGPSPQCMEQAGDKARARHNAIACGIPVIPGIEIDVINDNSRRKLDAFCQDVGYPVMIKQVHGGGGKTIKKIESPEILDCIWQLCADQSVGGIVVEKCIDHARHLEVQIAGDGKQVVHLYERECSVQRLNQKIIEQSPAGFLPDAVKDRLRAYAVRFAEYVCFNNIGTIEFLVDQQHEIYFLEANPRLQVEHAVTELVTGVDLVKLQIDLASGCALPHDLFAIQPYGHALECRIYAENPMQSFLPSIGTIDMLHLPVGPFLRVDHDLHEGQEITDQFDPMIAKITCWRRTEHEAIAAMRSALEMMIIVGIETNVELLKGILKDELFCTHYWHTATLNDPLLVSALIAQRVAELPEDYKACAAELAKQLQVTTLSSLAATAWMQQRW